MTIIKLSKTHSRPRSPLSLSGMVFVSETKASGKGFTVLDSRTSGLHVCSRDVFIYCTAESWRLVLKLNISLSEKTNKKKKKKKISCAQGPSLLVLRPHRLREAKRAMGTGMSKTMVKRYVNLKNGHGANTKNCPL